MLGFTKIGFEDRRYNEKGELLIVPPLNFCTIRYTNTIERRNIADGNIITSYMVDEYQFSEITCLLAVNIDSKDYLFVAEEGCILRKFSVD